MSDVNEITRRDAGEIERPPKVTFTREFAIPLPTKPETVHIISSSDWGRIQRNIKRIVPANKWFVIAGSTCAGVFFSAVFCMISLAAASSPPMWTMYAAGSATIVSLVLGCALFYLESQQRGNIAQSATDVIAEMEQAQVVHVPEEESPSTVAGGK